MSDYQLIEESFPFAHKVYKCIWCGEDIEKGLKHLHEKSRYDGQFQDHRWHLECFKAEQQMFKEDPYLEGFEAYDNERPRPVE